MKRARGPSARPAGDTAIVPQAAAAATGIVPREAAAASRTTTAGTCGSRANPAGNGVARGDTGRLALSSVGRESSPVLRTGIEPRCGSRPPCVLANHPVSPLPESRSPSKFRGPGPAILPRPAGQLGPYRQSGSELLRAEALPDCAADEEGAHAGDVAGSLARFTHGLHASRERMEIRTHQADDEVIVVAVEAERREADILRVTRSAEGVANGTVLAQNRGLFLGRERVELALPAQGIPNRPRPGGGGGAAARLVQKPIAEIGLMAKGVGAAQHGHFGLEAERGEGLVLQGAPEIGGEPSGIGAPGKERNAGGVVEIFIEHPLDLPLLERADQTGGDVAVAKGEQLQVEAAIGGLPAAALFAQFELFTHGTIIAAGGGRAPTWRRARAHSACPARWGRCHAGSHRGGAPT